MLVDFGACRDFSHFFTSTYLGIVAAAATGDRQTVLEQSRKIGFLTGEETHTMNDAHVSAVMVLGEPFSSPKPYDFGSQDVTLRIQQYVPIMLK